MSDEDQSEGEVSTDDWVEAILNDEALREALLENDATRRRVPSGKDNGRETSNRSTPGEASGKGMNKGEDWQHCGFPPFWWQLPPPLHNHAFNLAPPPFPGLVEMPGGEPQTSQYIHCEKAFSKWRGQA